jgi:hypothetical protein
MTDESQTILSGLPRKNATETVCGVVQKVQQYGVLPRSRKLRTESSQQT